MHFLPIYFFYFILIFLTVLERENIFSSCIVFSGVAFCLIKMFVMDMTKSFSSKPKKFTRENVMHYAPLIFLLYYFISLNFKLAGDCWKIFSYNLKFKIKIYFLYQLCFLKIKCF